VSNWGTGWQAGIHRQPQPDCRA